jgi:hypothetical protein
MRQRTQVITGRFSFLRSSSSLLPLRLTWRNVILASLRDLLRVADRASLLNSLNRPNANAQRRRNFPDTSSVSQGFANCPPRLHVATTISQKTNDFT